MDKPKLDLKKLQPVLEQRFWLMFVAALSLPIVGWFMTSKRLAAETAARIQAIDQSEKTIPTDFVRPNSQWVEEALRINDRKRAAAAEVQKRLWELQRAEMFWHPILKKDLDSIPFRGDVPNRARELYRTLYYEMADTVFRLVQPYDGQKEQGFVDCSRASLPFHAADLWANNAPPSTEVWDSQEDLWLTAALLKAIDGVNMAVQPPPLDIRKSPIRVLESLSLHGGVRSPGRRRLWAVSRAPVAGGEAAPPAAPPPEGGAAPPAGAPGPGPAPGRGGGADFDPTELYDGGAAPPPSVEEGATGPNPHARYVDVEAGLPFRTRGFYLSLVMDHESVPDLLIALSNLPWQVRIDRVHQVGMHGDQIDFGTAPTRTAVGGAESRGGIVEVALADPNLAHVAISGTLTLYLPPPAADPNAAAPADPAAGGPPIAPPEPAAEPVPAATPPAAPGTAPPAEPAATGPTGTIAPTPPATTPESKPPEAASPPATGVAPAGGSTPPGS